MKLEALQMPGVQLRGRMFDPPSSGLLALALIVSALLWLLGWYADTVMSAVAIWYKSETYAHGFVIVPISAWLVWQRRDVLAALDMRPAFPVLLLLAAAGAAWLFAHLAGVGVVQQFCLVFMMAFTVWAIVGTRAVRALAFPLFFLLFAVPFGEFLEPPLMEHTADFTVWALKMTGIPVYREGLYFTIPSGSWSVVQACSGLRYLIASITLGLLYAYLTYRSPVRRIAFVVASAIVPIFANWLRAYMIVMIGHLSGNKYAVGVDHLVYGWVLFGLVMLVLFWIGSRWREDIEPETSSATAPSVPARGKRPLLPMAIAAVAAAGIAAAWPLAASRLTDLGPYEAPRIAAPQAQGDWRRAEGRQLGDWTPNYQSVQAGLHEGYVNGTESAGVRILYYRHQRPGAQLITSKNTVVGREDKGWRVSESRKIVSAEGDVPLVESFVHGPSTRYLVWRWYWVDGRYVIDPNWAKVLQAKGVLLGHGDDAAAVFIYTPVGDHGLPVARKRLEEFFRATLPGITTSLENARRVQPAS